MTCLAQTPGKPNGDPIQAKSTAFQKQGTEALNRERARSKADLCTHTEGSDLAVSNCWLREGKTTDANYAAYVRSIGALLRLSLQNSRPTPPPAALPKRLEFDSAEATWLNYRKQSCYAMTAQWEGGTLGRVAYPECLVTVAWNHMNELARLYSGLWDRQ